MRLRLDRANSPRKSDLNGFIKFFQSCIFDPIAWMPSAQCSLPLIVNENFIDKRSDSAITRADKLHIYISFDHRSPSNNEHSNRLSLFTDKLISKYETILYLTQMCWSTISRSIY